MLEREDAIEWDTSCLYIADADGVEVSDDECDAMRANLDQMQLAKTGRCVREPAMFCKPSGAG